MSASAPSSTLPVVGSSGDDGQARRLRTGSQWSSRDSASPSPSSDNDEDATAAVKKEIDNQGEDDDDDDSAFSIDMDDLKRDLGIEIKPSVGDGADPASATSMPIERDLRSPSPIEVTVQRLPLVKLTPTQLIPNSKEKEKTIEATVDKVGF